MKKHQKLALGAVSILAAVTLVACGSSKSKNSSGITTLHMYQVGDKPDNFSTLLTNANKILEKKAGVKLNISFIGWGDYAEKMNIIVSSGEAYDIAFAQEYAQNAGKLAYADLTNLLPKYAKKSYKNLNPSYIKGNLINNKLYGFPVNANISAKAVMTFNKQYLDKYHLSIDGIDSYASAEKVLEEFHNKNPNVAALAIGKGIKTSADVDFVLQNTLPFAIDVKGDSKKIQNIFDIPNFYDNLKVIHSYYKKGLILPDASTSTTTYDLNANNWFARVETQGPFDYGDTMLTQAAGQPLVSKPLTESLITNQQARTANYVISNTSKHKKEAVKALDVINTDPELMNGLVYGVEGKQWKKIGDKKIKLLPSYSEGVKHLGAWNTANNALYYTTNAITNEMIKNRDKIIKEAKVSPLLGFTFDQSKVKSELSNIANVMSKHADEINTGSVDPSTTVITIKKELKEAGYDKVEKEMQQQYNAFLKNK